MSVWLGSDAERRSFDFFLARASQRFGEFFNAPFWSREVLQAAISFPSIRHLVVALGAAYEQFESKETRRLTEGDHNNDNMRFALQQCNTSIRHITNLSESSRQSLETMCCILTASILFGIFASLQGHFGQAIEHVRSGMRVLKNLDSLPSSTPSTFPVPVARLRSLLTNLYGQARTIINDEAKTKWDGQDPLVSKIEPVAFFLNLDDAQTYVQALYMNTLAFFQSREFHPPVTQEEMDAVNARREQLCSALRSSCEALAVLEARDATSSDDKPVTILHLYHTVLSMRLGISAFGEEKREALFDEAEHYLMQMLAYCRQILRDDGSPETRARPVYSSGLGVVMPLHTIAARCRNPAVRKEALDLLLRVDRREWIWDSTLTRRIVSTTIEFEQRATLLEGDLAALQIRENVPDDSRIREVKLRFQGERSASLEFITVAQWKNKQSGYQRFIQW